MRAAEITAAECETPRFPIPHWSSSVYNSGSQDTTIRVGFGLQAVKRTVYPVACHFYCLLNCAITFRQRYRQTDGRLRHMACRAKKLRETDKTPLSWLPFANETRSKLAAIVDMLAH